MDARLSCLWFSGRFIIKLVIEYFEIITKKVIKKIERQSKKDL
jgi:hypothetical protein